MPETFAVESAVAVRARIRHPFHRRRSESSAPLRVSAACYAADRALGTAANQPPTSNVLAGGGALRGSIIDHLRGIQVRLRKRMERNTLSNWFRVGYDDQRIYWDVSPPGGQAWTQQIEWHAITRVCFYAGDLFESDEIYLFTASRPESYVVPTEAEGGSELWSEILDRKLFDAELAIEAARGDRQLFCDPPAEGAATGT